MLSGKQETELPKFEASLCRTIERKTIRYKSATIDVESLEDAVRRAKIWVASVRVIKASRQRSQKKAAMKRWSE